MLKEEKSEMQCVEVGLSLGSNIGDRLRYIRQSKTLLLMDPSVRFIDQSSVYETEPVDVKEKHQQMKFLNAVLIVESSCTAQEWLTKIKKVEDALQRVRTDDRNAPRTIDVDILFVGEEVVDSENLQIPHPRWSDRSFVVEPLAEVRPNLILPDSGNPVLEIFEQMPASEDVCLYVEKKEWMI